MYYYQIPVTSYHNMYVVIVMNTRFNAYADIVIVWRVSIPAQASEYVCHNNTCDTCFNKGHLYLMTILYTNNEGKIWDNLFKIRPTFHQKENSTLRKMSWCSNKFNILVKYYGGFKRKEHFHSNTTILFTNTATCFVRVQAIFRLYSNLKR